MKKIFNFSTLVLLVTGLSFIITTGCDKTEEVSITFKPTVIGDSIWDVDGNGYRTVKIGDQTWLLENLRTTKYRNGDTLYNVTSKSIWAKLDSAKYKVDSITLGAQCAYFENADSIKKYGRLYNWYAVSDTRGLAPNGWHVATDEDWSKLENYLIKSGCNYDGTTLLNKVAISLADSSVWKKSTINGHPGFDMKLNNKSGFKAIPAGCRTAAGDFVKKGEYGDWWTATAPDVNNAYMRGLYFNSVSLSRAKVLKKYGYSVRCVKD